MVSSIAASGRIIGHNLEERGVWLEKLDHDKLMLGMEGNIESRTKSRRMAQEIPCQHHNLH